MSEQDDEEMRQAMDDMIATGCIFLNPVFRIKAPRKRIGRRFSLSIEGGEALWGFIAAVIVFSISFGIYVLAGRETPRSLVLKLIYSPMAWVVWSGMAFVLGRKLAYVSPFMKKSGEGASAWALVTIRKFVSKLASKVGLTTAFYNPVLTVMRDPENHSVQVTMAKEWIGLAPAPSAPWVRDPWVREKLKDIPPQERDYSLYPEACEQIDIWPTGSPLSPAPSLHEKAVSAMEEAQVRRTMSEVYARQDSQRRAESLIGVDSGGQEEAWEL